MQRFRQPAILICFFVVGLMTNGLAWADDKDTSDDTSGLTAGLSYDFSRGDYGTRNMTKLWSTTTSVEYERGDFLFNLSIPYLRQYGPVGTLIVGGKPVLVNGQPVVRGGHIVVGRAGQKVISGTVEGMGDVNTSVTYFKGGDENTPLFDMKLGVNFGTGEKSKGLGTGKNDYSLQGDLSQSFGDWIVSGTLGYSVVGKIKEAKLQNYYFGSADLSNKISTHSKVGIMVNYGQAVSAGSPDAQDVTLYYGYQVSKMTKLQVYLLKGLTNGSPDSGAGANINMSF